MCRKHDLTEANRIAEVPRRRVMHDRDASNVNFVSELTVRAEECRTESAKRERWPPGVGPGGLGLRHLVRRAEISRLCPQSHAGLTAFWLQLRQFLRVLGPARSTDVQLHGESNANVDYVS